MKYNLPKFDDLKLHITLQFYLDQDIGHLSAYFSA
jgi:hypothetical protein